MKERERGREGGREMRKGENEGRSCIGILHTSRDVKQEADNRQGERRRRARERERRPGGGRDNRLIKRGYFVRPKRCEGI